MGRIKDIGPLRKIIHISYVGDHWFAKDKAMLECGHRVWTHAAFRTRCWKCKKGISKEFDLQ